MKDRVPTYPGRVQLTPVAGQTNIYDMVRADEPTEAGSALNKANLLPDTVATALGLTGNPQVKDALGKLKALIDGNTTLANTRAKIEVGSYTGTGTYGSVSNSNTLTFQGVPYVVLIKDKTGALTPTIIYAGSGEIQAITYTGTTQGGQLTAGITGNTLSWYANGYWSGSSVGSPTQNAGQQLNDSGKVYEYLALTI